MVYVNMEENYEISRWSNTWLLVDCPIFRYFFLFLHDELFCCIFALLGLSWLFDHSLLVG